MEEFNISGPQKEQWLTLDLCSVTVGWLRPDISPAAMGTYPVPTPPT